VIFYSVQSKKRIEKRDQGWLSSAPVIIFYSVQSKKRIEKRDQGWLSSAPVIIEHDNNRDHRE